MRFKVWIFEPGEIPTPECNLYEIEWSTEEFSNMMALMGLDTPVRFNKMGIRKIVLKYALRNALIERILKTITN